jgi:hypothetical protein
MMNGELKADVFLFIIHHSVFILAFLLAEAVRVELTKVLINPPH